MGEDELIQTFFAPLTAGFPGALGLEDDAAVLVPPPGHDLVLTTDAVAAGVHFFPDDHAADIGWKALAVNVSDLVAKGARPLAYLLSLSFPDLPERAWLADFARGLSEAQAAFGIALAGGDTDRRPGPFTATVTAIGAVAEMRAVRRTTARAGDMLFLSGTLGDAALGLKLRGDAHAGRAIGLDEAACAALVARYLRPLPPLAIAPLLVDHASAAMDVSDGLIKDCGRLARASGVGAVIEVASLPLSVPARRALASQPALIETILAGGDDYQVLAAVPPSLAMAFQEAAAREAVEVCRIGRLVAGAGVSVFGPDGRSLPISSAGWDHFA